MVLISPRGNQSQAGEKQRRGEWGNKENESEKYWMEGGEDIPPFLILQICTIHLLLILFRVIFDCKHIFSFVGLKTLRQLYTTTKLIRKKYSYRFRNLGGNTSHKDDLFIFPLNIIFNLFRLFVINYSCLWGLILNLDLLVQYSSV